METTNVPVATIRAVSIRAPHKKDAKYAVSIYEAEKSKRTGKVLWKWREDLFARRDKRGDFQASAEFTARSKGLTFIKGIKHNKPVDSTLVG